MRNLQEVVDSLFVFIHRATAQNSGNTSVYWEFWWYLGIILVVSNKGKCSHNVRTFVRTLKKTTLKPLKIWQNYQLFSTREEQTKMGST